MPKESSTGVKTADGADSKVTGLEESVLLNNGIKSAWCKK